MSFRRKLKYFYLVFILLTFFLLANRVFAEDKGAPGQIIPKLQKTPNDPELFNGHVYPFWGPPCQRYTYSVIYRDKEARKPEYVKIYFNGEMIEMAPSSDPAKADYKQGVRYEYKYVPNKVDSNFYYFEASNGLGKARDSIIESPDNGPVLFTSAFDQNEIAVVKKDSGEKILSFSTGKEWIGGIALSDEGKYLAAKTSKHVYLFDTEKPEKPLWAFNFEEGNIGDDVKGGVAISGNGEKIIAGIGNMVLLFNKSSSQPIWKYPAGNSYNVAISKDGKYLAAATAGEEENLNSNLILLWNEKSEKPLWQYHASGNFHDVSLSFDGSFISGSTGCPDRRFYLFSKDSNEPLIRSESLTRDSPVHRAKISADGNLMAVASEADAGAVFLFSKEKGQVWKFPTLRGSSVRALNFTQNGEYIGAATFGGDVYIFSKSKPEPLVNWQVNASLGGVDIADDGSFLAAGGTDRKLYLFDRETREKTEISFNEYIAEVDIAANGQYIAAGTGGSVYFFETYISPDREKTFTCTEIIEPEPQEMAMAGYNQEGQGNQVSSPRIIEKKSPMSILLSFAVLVVVLALSYGLLVRFPKIISLTHPLAAIVTLPTAIILWGINGYQFNFQAITDFCGLAFSFWTILLFLSLRFKIPRGFFIFGALLFAFLGSYTLITYQPFFSGPTLVHLLEVILGFGYLSGLLKGKLSLIFLTGVVLFLSLVFLGYQFLGSGTLPALPADNVSVDSSPATEESSQAVCGNNLCEPDFGETRTTCPQDCSAGD